MGNIRRKHSGKFKAQVVLDLLKEDSTIAEICSKHAIHSTQAGKWKQQAIQGLPVIFDKNINKKYQKQEELISKLYQDIGRLTVERDYLKKNY